MYKPKRLIIYAHKHEETMELMNDKTKKTKKKGKKIDSGVHKKLEEKD